LRAATTTTERPPAADATIECWATSRAVHHHPLPPAERKESKKSVLVHPIASRSFELVFLRHASIAI